MKPLRALLSLALAAISASAFAADGLVSMKSPYDAKQTMNRLEDIVKQKGFTVFARIDHAAGASQVGMKLRPTELLIFGNPKAGTLFMDCAQSVGIDLPLKALVWEDASSQVWLSYNDPEWVAKRHDVSSCPVVANISKALAGIATAATSK
jgi:uncharacterized protein (DUF302 family)